MNSFPGTLPYGAHQMLVGSQFALPPGLVISMPITSHGESSAVASVASSSREEERGPYRSSDRERSSTPTPHKSQPRASASETHERIQRLKDSEKDSRRSPVMFHEERSRNRSAASEQNVSPKPNSRPRDLKTEDGASHGRQGIISNNLAISRLAGHMDALTDEELMRRQRLAVEYSDPSLHMNYYPGLIRMDPAFAANMMQSSSQHIGRGMEHFITKRP
ncbi:PREDICTED: uncharacterized protein LOC107338560 isoform X2 [Acropora digitifera]|uniref:uncharacterized protein LOC107338560 isoform X2 n=1 Tax=Acropora digitifera TaxID=70779 RepID=UPI00077AEDAB|nr:PREDICTED: uncharacterized protein LOC107338560 isoform X2 [Acropora digitifera]